MKVLIYSSKEIYDNSSFEGRAEADLIAYAIDNYYQVVKNTKTSDYLLFTKQSDLLSYGKIKKWILGRHITRVEREEY